MHTLNLLPVYIYIHSLRNYSLLFHCKYTIDDTELDPPKRVKHLTLIFTISDLLIEKSRFLIYFSIVIYHV